MTKGSLAQIDLHPPIPKTVVDSMELVSLIGERYLWVDCLCLVQDDEEDMGDGISKMDLVYRGAKAIIVATTGVDANAGLPGICPGSRELLQYIEEVKPRVRMTIVNGLFGHFSGLYHTGGWT
jgi:Heterokaryon incompatibility protein (HET)